MYGGFTSNVDMKTGSPAFGTPEYMKAQHASGQLARLGGILPIFECLCSQHGGRAGRLRSGVLPLGSYQRWGQHANARCRLA